MEEHNFDLYYNYEDQLNDYEAYEEYYDEIGNFTDILNECIKPSITQILQYVLPILTCNLIYRILVQLLAPNVCVYVLHIVSILFGAFILYTSLEVGILYFIGFSIIYLINYNLIIYFKYNNFGHTIAITSILILVIGEALQPDIKLWHQMRGTQMVIIMKVISLGYDLDASPQPSPPTTLKQQFMPLLNSISDDRQKLPIQNHIDSLEFMGYLFCPGNSLFGPWISFREYLQIYEKPSKFNIKWILAILLNLIVSIGFLICSNCLLTSLITDNNPIKPLIIYRDAMSFRYSHYFIIFLSQFILLVAGYAFTTINNVTTSNCYNNNNNTNNNNNNNNNNTNNNKYNNNNDNNNDNDNNNSDNNLGRKRKVRKKIIDNNDNDKDNDKDNNKDNDKVNDDNKTNNNNNSTNNVSNNYNNNNYCNNCNNCKNYKFHLDNVDVNWKYFLTKPWLIEWPRSLVQIVVVWNISMHQFLKKYIFRTAKKQYGTFMAIFSTYFVSAVLHGLNLQLAVILLSLGLFTYVEYKLREKLAKIYNACILAKSCPSLCNHEHKWYNPYVLMVNILFSIITIIHLAYLGVMFEASISVQEEGYSLLNAFEHWNSLYFFSHWFVLFSYIFYVII